MNELIKIEDREGKQTVCARKLWEFLKVPTRFNDWIRNHIVSFNFQENQDFVTLTENLVSGGMTKEYYISLGMAKELAMLQRTEKGKKARLYFLGGKVSKIIYQQSFTDPSWKPIGCGNIRVIAFSDGLIQFCDADDDDLLCSCTINDISQLAEAYTDELINTSDKNITSR